MEREVLESELRDLRAKLDAELDRASGRHDPFGHMLQQLAGQADPTVPESVDQQLLDALREAVAEQSLDHPQLTAVARQLLDILSRMGI
ncbi:DUF4404 family protein [Porticoccaceae bacterium]|nr:DUF4404 family protein [Porticoccaceae bacterium]